MKQFFALLIFWIAFIFLFSGNIFAQCDGERWSVKTGTDSDAARVNLSAITATTIGDLSGIAAPNALPENSRIQPTEMTTWILNANLVKYARSEDADYHLVFADSAGRTMIAEIPDPLCVGANSPFAAGIARARQQFDAVLTATNSFQSTNVPVQITGVGFFDYNVGQEGIAPNGIELHPIIDIIFGQTQQLFGNSGFENAAANPLPWTATAGVIDNSSYQPPRTGLWKAWLNGYGSTHSDTLWQQVSIPAGAANAKLSFWLHIDTAETTKVKTNDKMKVQVRNSAGTVLADLATYSNLNAAAGYKQVSFDLNSYKGQTIQIYLVGTENSTLQTSFVVDDFALNVIGAVTSTPDFFISASPGLLNIVAGNSATAAIETSISGNFNSTVSFSATGLPAGTTANFNPKSIAAPGSGSSAMTVSVGSSTLPGTYNILVNGTGGGLTRSTSISLNVSGSGGTQQLLGNPGFENGSANPSPWAVTTGVIDNSSYQSARSGAWKAWLNGYGTVHTDTLSQQINIPATATGVTLSFWRHIDTAEKSATTAYDTMKVQIRNTSGTVLSTLAVYSNLDAAAGFLQNSFDLTSYKGQTIQICITGTEDSSLQTSFVVDDFALNITVP